MIACCNLSDCLAVLHHSVAMTWYGFVAQLDADKLACDTLSLLLYERVTTDKLLLVELAEESQSGHYRRDISRQLVAIERKPHLKAQCVTASESARLALSTRHELVPCLAYLLVRAVNLKAVLASISCAADDDVADSLHGIECEVSTLVPEHLLHYSLGLRSLYSELSVIVRDIPHVDIEALGVLCHPCPVLVDIGSVDDDEEVVVTHLVDEEVIDCSAISVKHHAVENLPYGHILNVVGEDVVDVTLSVRTFHSHLAHVADIENTTGVADSLMLVDNTRILYRHIKTAEGADESS